MSGRADALGGRLPLADPAALRPAQREIFDRMAEVIVPWADEARFQSTAEDGRLIGPFNPALLNPAIAAPFLDLQFAEHMHTSLSPRVREVVILAVGAVWQADYELYAHLALARKAGLSDEAARAVAAGRIADGLSYDELIALRLTQQLSTSHRVDESLYRQAENSFGAKGLIDIAFLIGIYHSVCATLTMFAIPAPE
ncbi:carboxymuconolactone decarboxylase family protein [Mycolicibacterium moriokaense]|uniref:4-carboxymuconolactone decarboxylase n=1 Tax=Mycolicibacterium moriokaense TaxID=39691 RepID=A0A318H1Z2_9MYCO|nr:carboxymuconolactone decarboxylase family protein [Mycolicibacterium moriokaense]PXW97165.1 4-carboxymuconolactone decarboxylase [Mycolicibacterium moriokaense]